MNNREVCSFPSEIIIKDEPFEASEGPDVNARNTRRKEPLRYSEGCSTKEELPDGEDLHTKSEIIVKNEPFGLSEKCPINSTQKNQNQSCVLVSEAAGGSNPFNAVFVKMEKDEEVKESIVEARNPIVEDNTQDEENSISDTQASEPQNKRCRLSVDKRSSSNLMKKQEKLFKSVQNLLSIQENPSETYGRAIGLQLKDIPQVQRYIVEKLISDIFFYGKFEKLTPQSSISLNNSVSNNPLPSPLLSVLLHNNNSHGVSHSH